MPFFKANLRQRTAPRRLRLWDEPDTGRLNEVFRDPSGWKGAFDLAEVQLVWNPARRASRRTRRVTPPASALALGASVIGHRDSADPAAPRMAIGRPPAARTSVDPSGPWAFRRTRSRWPEGSAQRLGPAAAAIPWIVTTPGALTGISPPVPHRCDATLVEVVDYARISALLSPVRSTGMIIRWPSAGGRAQDAACLGLVQ